MSMSERGSMTASCWEAVTGFNPHAERRNFICLLPRSTSSYSEHDIYCSNRFKLHGSLALSTFTLLFSHHHHPSPEPFSSSLTENPYPLSNNSPSLHSIICLCESDYSRYLIWVELLTFLVHCDCLTSLSILSSRFTWVAASSCFWNCFGSRNEQGDLYLVDLVL